MNALPSGMNPSAVAINRVDGGSSSVIRGLDHRMLPSPRSIAVSRGDGPSPPSQRRMPGSQPITSAWVDSRISSQSGSRSDALRQVNPSRSSSSNFSIRMPSVGAIRAADGDKETGVPAISSLRSGMPGRDGRRPIREDDESGSPPTASNNMRARSGRPESATASEALRSSRVRKGSSRSKPRAVTTATAVASSGRPSSRRTSIAREAAMRADSDPACRRARAIRAAASARPSIASSTAILPSVARRS